jgi:aminoglycoside phosphotransferase (APT) family kinase protein
VVHVSTEGALDLKAIETWLDSRGRVVVAPMTATQIQGGRSNLTYFLTAADGARWVLRRPPLGRVMATAHDVGREVKVLLALYGHVPVPAVVGEGVDGTGVPFYVMHEVPGRVIRTDADALDLSPQARGQCGPSMMAGLAALHQIEPDRVGLGQFGRGTEYLQRQVRLWQRMGDQYRTSSFPEADAIRDRLLRTAPTQEHVVLVHGDYRLDNVLVDDAGALNAMLDWELCTRGDPFVDLAVCLYYWTESADLIHPFAHPATVLPSFANREDLLVAYVAAGGRRLPRPDFYFGYAAWRLSLVFEGVLGRFRDGAYGASDVAEEERLAGVIKHLIAHAAELLARDEAQR